jgi:hypothetical protein
MAKKEKMSITHTTDYHGLRWSHCDPLDGHFSDRSINSNTPHCLRKLNNFSELNNQRGLASNQSLPA